MQDRVPQLASLAHTYMSVLTNSADAEGSFSLYNLLVMDARRRQLTENNIKALMFLYYNLNQFDAD